MKRITPKNTIFCVLAAMILVCFPGCAGHAGQGGGKPHKPPLSADEMLTEFDKDNDGRLSMSEFPGPDAHFVRFDKNDDGYLEADEIPDGPPPKK